VLRIEFILVTTTVVKAQCPLFSGAYWNYCNCVYRVVLQRLAAIIKQLLYNNIPAHNDRVELLAGTAN